MASPNEEDEQLQQLQLQFNRMATNDKEVLIKQLQKIVGPSLNHSTATFFLDMNNWNLQLATNSYFDLLGSNNDVLLSTTAFNCSFQCSYFNLELEVGEIRRVDLFLVNSGESVWPPGCSFRMIRGQPGLVHNNQGEKIEKVWFEEAIKPTHTLTLILNFKLNPTHETHEQEQSWQLVTPDGYSFGELINFKITQKNSLIDEFEKINL